MAESPDNERPDFERLSDALLTLGIIRGPMLSRDTHAVLGCCTYHADIVQRSHAQPDPI